jgi:hypothetical protein
LEWVAGSNRNPQQLAESAKNSIAGLDRRLGILSDQVGLDVTGGSAATAEMSLLNRLKLDPSAQHWQGLIAAASRDPDAQSVLLFAMAR